MKYEMINEYEEDGLKIKVARPVLSDVERIERGGRIASQLKSISREYKLKTDANPDT